MRLNELLKNVETLNIVGDVNVEITGVNIDSRRIEKGHLFVAIPGTVTDGHKFIPKAIELGATAVLCEKIPEEQTPEVTYVHYWAAFYKAKNKRAVTSAVIIALLIFGVDAFVLWYNRFIPLFCTAYRKQDINTIEDQKPNLQDII